MTTKVPWRAHWKRRCWRKSARSLATAAEVEVAAKAAEEAASNPWRRNSVELVRSPPLSDAPSMWVVVAPPDVVGLPHQPTYS
uniref:Uncharacterized protein n=1 Tax=Oryza barthii TaxID=65489 RepID=A0A0D3HJB5_9ORYZ